jgi:hypothetical protein
MPCATTQGIFFCALASSQREGKQLGAIAAHKTALDPRLKNRIVTA